MEVDDGKRPLWMRGDSNRGLALWPVEDGAVLSVHLEASQTDLHLTPDDVLALYEALGPMCAPAEVPAAAPDVPMVSDAPEGPPCDRCKNPTLQTADGYACTSCGNKIVWV